MMASSKETTEHSKQDILFCSHKEKKNYDVTSGPPDGRQISNTSVLPLTPCKPTSLSKLDRQPQSRIDINGVSS